MKMKITSMILCLCFLFLSSQTAFAQKSPTFKVKALIANGQKSKQQKTRLKFGENSFSSFSKKSDAAIKEFDYSDIKTAELAYSEKPLMSQSTAIVAALLFSYLSYPLLFVKTKQYWLTIRTADDYLVLKLKKSDRRKILQKFAEHQVNVNEIGEEGSEIKY